MEPKVYVACLASYNAGVLHGAWVDATSAENIHEGIAEILKTSKQPLAEEWAFHDYEDMPDGLGEYESVERVAELGAFIEKHEEAGIAWLDLGGEPDDFNDAYCGEWPSEVEYAEELVEDLGMLSEMPESLRFYFDYEAFARDLFMSDYRYEDGFVFRVT